MTCFVMPDLLGYLLYIALHEIPGQAGDDGREGRTGMTGERERPGMTGRRVGDETLGAT